MGILEVIPIGLCTISMVACLFVLVMYYLFRGTRVHPNQIIIHRAFADLMFSLAYLLSVYLKRTGDINCETDLGHFTSVISQYSLLASEVCYFYLAVDGLISVSRPFTNPKTRYSFYGISIHVISIAMGLSLNFFPISGRHVTGICWIRSIDQLINWGSWEYLFIWVIIIYCASCVLLVKMANCLNRLPIYQEGLLQNRAVVLEKMMFYVFTFIIYGLCLWILYSLIEMINHHFPDWTPHFLTSQVLEALFYCVASSRGLVTAFVFLDNIKDIFKDRNLFNRDGAWYREVQPLLNEMIRHQLLDVFSRGVKQSIESSTYSNDSLLFNRENGIHRDILTNDRYYKDSNKIDIQATTVQSKKKENDESDKMQFVEYAPLVFSYLRYLNGVKNSEYIDELSGLTDCNCSEGSSGALFVKSQNHWFIIKFVNESEFMVLNSILKELTTYLTLEQIKYTESQSSDLDMREGETTQNEEKSPSVSHEYPNAASMDEEIAITTEVTESNGSFFEQPKHFSSLHQVNSNECAPFLRNNANPRENGEYLPGPSSILVDNETLPLVDPPFVSTSASDRINIAASTSSDYLLLQPKISHDSRSPSLSCNISPTPQLPDSFATPKSDSYRYASHQSQSFSYMNDYGVQPENQVIGSFLNKYYGMYSLEVFGSTLYFLVMENLLPDAVDEVYDLKGSWVGRETREPKRGQILTCRYCQKSFAYNIGDEKCDKSEFKHHHAVETKKDNSFRTRFTLHHEVMHLISAQLTADVKFLCEHGLMDYSVLLGIRKVEIDVIDYSQFPLLSCYPQYPYITPSIEGPGIFYIGIIDYLQKYTLKKKLERMWKCFFRCADRSGISDVPPTQYRDRIMSRVIGKLFKDNSYSNKKTEIMDYSEDQQFYDHPHNSFGFGVTPPPKDTAFPSRSNSFLGPKQDSRRSIGLQPGGDSRSNRIKRSQNSDSMQSLAMRNVSFSSMNVTMETSQSSSLMHQSSSSRCSANLSGRTEVLLEQQSVGLRGNLENPSTLGFLDEESNDADVYTQRGVV